MLIFRIFAVVAAILGGVSGVLRIFELQGGYDASGLAVEGDPYRLGMIIISTVLIVLAVIVAFGLQTSERRNSPLVFTCPKRSVSLVYFASVAVFAFAALFMILGCIAYYSATVLISGIFLFFAAASMILISFLLAKAVFPKEYSFLALVPTFWACYELILDFRSETQNPVMASYIFGISALVFLVLTFFFQADILHNRRMLRRTYFAANVSLYLNLLCAISEFPGVLVQAANKATFLDKIGLFAPVLVYAGGALYAAYVLCCLLRGRIVVPKSTVSCDDEESAE